MAILEHCPGLKVQVIVDDQPLQEYQDDESPSDAKTVSKYVESTTGKNFAFKVTYQHPFPTKQDVEVKISIDGAVVAYDRCAAKDLYQPGEYIHDGPIVKIGAETFQQNFMFKSVDSIEHHHATSALITDTISRTGTITLAFQHCANVRPAPVQHQAPQLSLELGEVPESAMKADPKSHQAWLTEPTPLTTQLLEEWDHVGDAPFATFHFHYRSLEVLQAMHIAPLPAELADRAGEVLTPAETLRILQTLKKRGARDAGGGEEDDVELVASHAVRKRRLGRVGGTRDDAIDVDATEEDEGTKAIMQVSERYHDLVRAGATQDDPIDVDAL
jgi:hypothetical protein